MTGHLKKALALLGMLAWAGTASAGFLYVEQNGSEVGTVTDPLSPPGSITENGSLPQPGSYLDVTAKGFPTPDATITGPETKLNTTFTSGLDIGAEFGGDPDPTITGLSSMSVWFYDYFENFSYVADGGIYKFNYDVAVDLDNNAAMAWTLCAGGLLSDGTFDSNIADCSASSNLATGEFNTLEGPEDSFSASGSVLYTPTSDKFWTAIRLDIWHYDEAGGASLAVANLRRDVPAPAPLVLLGSGLLALGLSVRRRNG
jgi:hypothetical protein